MTSILVVPSIRPDSLRDFLGAWEGTGDWAKMIVVEDGPTKTCTLPPKIMHMAWEDIGELFGDKAKIFSHRDSAIRCAGFVAAYRMGADLIVTLDDDCYPHDGTPIVAGHMRAMCSHSKWVESIPGMRTRGIPYLNRGGLVPMANMGLWSHIPDLDSIQTLAGYPETTSGGFEPPRGSRIIPAGQYFPMCGMNLAFARDATPLFYFPLMGEGQPYRRFDDIWCGVIAKKVMDHLGWPFSVGEPFVKHMRASQPMANLEREAPGIVANETFWEAVDGISLSARDPVGCMMDIGEGLIRNDNVHSHPYPADLGRAIVTWAGLFA